MNAIYTLEFWKQVQQDHCKMVAMMLGEYLCLSSDAFLAAWEHNQQDIRDLATLFLDQDDHWYALVTSSYSNSVVLFHANYDEALNLKNRQELRAQFIAWNIKRIKAAEMECNGAS